MNTAIISAVIMAAVVALFVLDRFPGSAVAAAGLVAMIAFGVCDVKDALSGFSSDIFLLLLGMQLLGSAMFTSGAAATIGKAAIRLSGGRERRFLLIACVIAALLSAFLSNTAVIAMMFSV